MTARKASFRGRRRGAGRVQIPNNIAAWFAGERRFTFLAYTAPHAYRLREYWGAWAADHPDAVPPPGYELAASCGEMAARLCSAARAAD